jgi:hypothetical protein
MRDLVSVADVVISGYRPDVLGKWGFGQEDIVKISEKREECNLCQGELLWLVWLWSGKKRWQQISDAVYIHTRPIPMSTFADYF